MLWTINKQTGEEIQNIQVGNQDVQGIAGWVNKSRIGRNIKNLSTIINLA